MQKIKEWFKANKEIIFLGLTMFISGLMAYIGFKKGSSKEDKEKKQAEIDLIDSKAENVILKERIADEKKSLHEISSDVDDLLDRK